MLSLEELQQLTINDKIVREAFAQAQKRLEDTLETKKAFEQKATTLLGAYVTISLALSGAGVAIFNNPTIVQHRWPIWLASALLVLGAFCFVGALWDARYGALGSDPEMWLRDGTINATEDTALPSMLAFITYHHKKRISEGVRSNEIKARLIRAGVVLGALAPLALLALFAVS